MIDCDVHNDWATAEVLLPYLDQNFRDYFVRGEMPGPKGAFPHAHRPWLHPEENSGAWKTCRPDGSRRDPRASAGRQGPGIRNHARRRTAETRRRARIAGRTIEDRHNGRPFFGMSASPLPGLSLFRGLVLRFPLNRDFQTPSRTTTGWTRSD